MSTMMELRNAIRAKLDERMTNNFRKYSGGQASDFASYKFQSGRTMGLNDAKDIVDETFKFLIEEGYDDK